MNIKLAFTPVSSTPVDLLAMVLDAEKTLHEMDDPVVAAHVEKAAAGFREKTLKREYFATLPEGARVRERRRLLESPAQGPQPLGEPQDLHRAHACGWPATIAASGSACS